MTAQIPDTLLYDDCEWMILASATAWEFDPRDYGVTPHSNNSSCMRGCICRYELSTIGLHLKDILIALSYRDEVRARAGKATAIANVAPRPYRNSDNGEMEEVHQSMYLYPDVGIPIDLTGALLIGRNRAAACSSQSQPSSHFSIEFFGEVRDLSFEKGRLIEAQNVSTDAVGWTEKYTSSEELSALEFKGGRRTESYWEEFDRHKREVADERTDEG